MKPRLITCGVVTALVVAATGLAGCGSADPSAAAVVDGKAIKDADVWAVINDLAKVPRNKDITVADVLPALIMARVVQEHAEELKAPAISAEAARQQLESAVPQGQLSPAWDPATVQAFQDVSALSIVMNGPTQPKAVELIQKSTVTVNPKYGQFDRQRLTLMPATPNWMVATPAPGTGENAPAPQPAPQPGGNPSTLPGATSGPTSAPGSPAPGGTAPAPAATTPAPRTTT